MMKKTFKILLVGIMLLLSSNTASARVAINLDGTVTIKIGSSKSKQRETVIDWGRNTQTTTYYTDNDMIDYPLIPFIINNKGYALIVDYKDYYILQVEFFNNNPNRVKSEKLYAAKIYNDNCIGIIGDSSGNCLTVTTDGFPALWSRKNGKVIYKGYWANRRRYYNNNDDYVNW